ncbi:hypothetical protein DY000_02002120 [Brassica cretica]|uniref:Uncharacterized protein n=1 Tax=Brassica cretica TaxID=69181 RepID=A0ABQ7C332_BRACR|nr:hypothetical protein DY000_02002120 [Brassica cretica]
MSAISSEVSMQPLPRNNSNVEEVVLTREIELYVGQLQLLKKMFPGGDKDKFLSISNKIEDAVSQFKQDSPLPPKSITMQRSLSAGSPRFTSRGINPGPPDLRDEWFKVRTVDAGGAAVEEVKAARQLVKARPRNSRALWMWPWMKM